MRNTIRVDLVSYEVRQQDMRNYFGEAYFHTKIYDRQYETSLIGRFSTKLDKNLVYCKHVWMNFGKVLDHIHTQNRRQHGFVSRNLKLSVCLWPSRSRPCFHWFDTIEDKICKLNPNEIWLTGQNLCRHLVFLWITQPCHPVEGARVFPFARAMQNTIRGDYAMRPPMSYYPL